MSDPIRFTVSSHLIDHERMGQAIAHFYRSPESRKRLFGLLAVFGLLAFILHRLDHPGVAVLAVGWMVFVTVMSYTGLSSTMKERLEAPGSAYEGFFFTADHAGTSEVSTTRRIERGWHDYQRASSVDGHLVLMLHDRSVRAVPWVALDEGDPESAMARIEGWMTTRADVPT